MQAHFILPSHNATTRKNKKSLQATAQDIGTCANKALNVECFGQPASKLQTVVFIQTVVDLTPLF